MPKPDIRKINAKRFQNEPTNRGLEARLNLAVIFPYEDWFIAELHRGTEVQKIIGIVIQQFGELLGVTALNAMQGQDASAVIMATTRLTSEVQIKALETVIFKTGVKKRSTEQANDNQDTKE